MARSTRPTRPQIAQDFNHKLTKSQILALQKILKANGLYKGKMDGRWTAWVSGALKNYQKRNGLPESGAYDTATDQFLNDTFQKMAINSRPIKGMDAKTKKFAEETYGYLMVWVRDPEIGPILIKAAKEGWDQARLEGKLKPTKWWKTKSAQERAWQNQIWQDPATTMQRRAQQEASIRNQVRSMGAHMAGKRFSQLVEDSLKYAWSSEQITDALLSEIKFRPGQTPTGSLATDMRRLQVTADRQMVKLGERQSWDWAVKIASGEMTLEDVNVHLSEKAALQYTHLADQLRGGVTMSDLFSEHRRVIADTLELDEDSLDLTDPRWAEIIERVEGDTVRASTVGEARLAARRQPGFLRTASGKEDAAGLAMLLGTTFGRRA